MVFWKDMLLPLLVGYLMGAIPIGYLVGKLNGVDVRRLGSGRTGSTNVLRAAGVAAAVVTVLGDALKGMAAVWLAHALFGAEMAAAMAGLAAVIGHNWSVFLKFRGGAGGITAGAVLIALNPVCGVIVAALGIAAFAIWRMASVATLTVALLSPVSLCLAALWFNGPAVHMAYGVAVAVVIVVALLPNIERLKAGTERYVDLAKLSAREIESQ